MKENSIKNERSSIEEAVKTMEHWVEYEKNNKDKINKADELIYIQETILSDYKRVLKINEVLLKENEELKIKEFQLHLATEEMKSMIYKQKVKDKIEEILNNKEHMLVFEGNEEFTDDATIINAQKYIKLEKTQELIEEREEK